MKRDSIEWLSHKQLVAQVTNPSELSQHLGTGRTFYFGVDPTADSLHVGHLVLIKTAAHLQAMGHRLVILLGGGTAMIGDPSGRTSMREMLAEDRIARNMEMLKKQLDGFFDLASPKKGMYVNNADWLRDLNYVEFIRDIGRHFSVNRMLTAECFKQRLEKGLSFLEFNYMLLQSYDFYHLCKHFDVTLQIGGDDQWSHMLGGTNLIRRLITTTASVDAFVFTVPLLVSSDGKKMGKTAAGAVWLDPEKTSPLEFFQYWRNLEDADILSLLTKLTDLTDEEIQHWRKVLVSGASTSVWAEAKEMLATELTSYVHGDEEAKRVRELARGLFGSTHIVSITHKSATLKELMDPIWIPWQDSLASQSKPLVELMVLAGMAASKKEARRLITQGGVQVGGRTCEDPQQSILRSELGGDGLWLQKGKKQFFLLKYKTEGCG